MVKDIEEAREFCHSVFRLESSESILGGDGTIKVSMVKVGNTLSELLQPLGSKGTMAKFLEKHGEDFHHICNEVDDIKEEIASLKAAGIEVLGGPRPGAEGMSVFIHPKGTHGVLIELVEKRVKTEDKKWTLN